MGVCDPSVVILEDRSMKPNTIRMIDAWLGRPLCLILTLFRYFLSAFGKKREGLTKPEKILFLKLVEQGSTVLAYRALLQAVKKVGKENVYFCVFEDNRFILDILDIVPGRNVFPIRQTNLIVFIYDTVRFLLKVRTLGIDAVIDMEFFSRASAIFSYLSGARFRVGLHRFTRDAPYRGDLMTHRIQYNPYIHAANYFLMLVETLDHDPEEIPLLKASADTADIVNPDFCPLDQETVQVRDLIKRSFEQEPKGPIVLLNPNAGDMMPLRKWEGSRFVDLGKKILSQSNDISIIFTGMKAEQESTESLCRSVGSPRAISLAGKTTIRELMVLYTLSDVLVTNDSGPAHFASMTDISVIVMFGPETPQLYRPLGRNTHVLWSGIYCSPCVSVCNHRFSPCTDNVCMKKISVEQVFLEVKRCMDH